LNNKNFVRTPIFFLKKDKDNFFDKQLSDIKNSISLQQNWKHEKSKLIEKEINHKIEKQI
jgi:hypothetical protein